MRPAPASSSLAHLLFHPMVQEGAWLGASLPAARSLLPPGAPLPEPPFPVAPDQKQRSRRSREREAR